ncbi:hypothetical protein FACS1894156_7430 [Bacteroidia bacterium]|nr:hypothetical protein FACS1894156_7430 [Bacteroidia bacterium]
MIATKNTHSLRMTITNIIFAGVVLLISCTKEVPDSYAVRFTNSYFEPLHSLQIGAVWLADTLLVGETTLTVVLPGGSYSFSTETASSLRLSTKVQLQGIRYEVNLAVDEQGRVVKF